MTDMEVYVKNVRETKIFSLLIPSDSTILDLKNTLGKKYNVPGSNIKIIFKSVLLKDDEELVIAIDFNEKSPFNFYVQTNKKGTKIADQTKQQQSQQGSEPKQEEPQKEEIKSENPQLQIPQLDIPNQQHEIPSQFRQTSTIEQFIASQFGQAIQPMAQQFGQASQVQRIIIPRQSEPPADFIDQYISMGFTREQIEEALQLCQNNSELASELIISGDISMENLTNIVQQNYQTQTIKAQVVGGNKVVVTVTQNAPAENQEKEQIRKHFLQMYEEMDEKDKKNVDLLKETGIDIVDCVNVYLYYQNDFEAAKQYCINAKKRLEAAQRYFGYY